MSSIHVSKEKERMLVAPHKAKGEKGVNELSVENPFTVDTYVKSSHCTL